MMETTSANLFRIESQKCYEAQTLESEAPCLMHLIYYGDCHLLVIIRLSGGYIWSTVTYHFINLNFRHRLRTRFDRIGQWKPRDL